MTKIGILGSGEVGKALSRAFMGHGYQIVLGSDHAEKTAAEFKKENPELETASFEQCARLADLAVLCVKGTAAEKVVGQVKAELSGKTVIDATLCNFEKSVTVLEFSCNIVIFLLRNIRCHLKRQ